MKGRLWLLAVALWLLAVNASATTSNFKPPNKGFSNFKGTFKKYVVPQVFVGSKHAEGWTGSAKPITPPGQSAESKSTTSAQPTQTNVVAAGPTLRTVTAGPQITIQKPAFNATKVMVNFYTLGLMHERAKMASPRIGPAYAKWIGRQRDALVEQYAPEVANYVTHAVAGELRFAVKRRLGGEPLPAWLTKAVYDNNNSLGGRAGGQQAILEAAKREGLSPQQFAQVASRIFSQPGWGVDFGGKKWANIADAISHYHEGRMTKTAWLDHVFDLQHNGGSIFDGKVDTVRFNDVYGSRFLQRKLEASDPVKLLEDMHSQVAFHSQVALEPEVAHVLLEGAAVGAWAKPRWGAIYVQTARTLTPAQELDLPSSKVAWFDDVGSKDTLTVGGKGANLGEMAKAGLPVPPGYVVTAQSFRTFFDESGLGAEIDGLLAKVDINNPAELAKVSKVIQTRIQHAEVSPRLREEIVHSYQKLGPNARVAVRSSGTVEDGADASFAGMFRSHLNVKGSDDLIRKVKDAWASAFGERTLAYAKKQGTHAAEHPVAVVVMKMVQSEKSGVMFTTDPTSGKNDRIVIESTDGLGEAVVSGEVVPGRAVLSKSKFQVLEQHESGDGKHAMTSSELKQLSELAAKVEKHYGTPQDIEFAFEGGKVYLVQTRPITKVQNAAKAPKIAIRADAKSLTNGTNASAGTVTGRVRIVHTAADAAAFQEGDILVADKTLPDWVPAMMRAKAIVTNNGGLISHAAIIARELGVPAIVGTKNATQHLRDGMIITVDGQSGHIFDGDAIIREKHARLMKELFGENEAYAALYWPSTAPRRILVN